MTLRPESLRIVVLECLYDNFGFAPAFDLFSKVVQLKFAGYRPAYPYGVLPTDTTDFVATHNLVCETTDAGQLRPIMGYRNITQSRCKTHNLPFPAIGVARSSNASQHDEAIHEILANSERRGTDIAYGSSWTVDPSVRRDRPSAALLRDLMGAIMINQYQDEGTAERMCCGSIRYKTDQFFSKLGYRPITLRGNTLTSFPQASLLGDHAVMLHCNQFTSEARELARRFRSLWDSRLHMKNGILTEMQPEKIAA